jgi:hypothetical protein
MSGPLVSASAAFVAKNSRILPFAIEQSLRSDADNQNLKRTPATSGNKQTWTWSGWIKRGELGAEQHFFESWEGTGDVMTYARFHSNDTIRVKQFQSGDIFELQTNAVFRDPSAWYHVVLSFDTTQATSSDRAKIYVNGELQSLGTANYPSQNLETFVNQSGYIHHLFADLYSSSRSFNGYMAEVHLIDGTALDPTSFGETNSDGVWVPTEYTGSHGTEGWYMKFDETATNGIGHDHSGNGNNLTPSNFTTSGTGTDVMSDTPTTNCATLNAVDNNGGTLSEGNLKSTSAGASNVNATIAVSSGKWYWEVLISGSVSGGVIGIGAGSAMNGTALGNLSKIYGWSPGGDKYENTTNSYYTGVTYTVNDNIGVAFNADTRELTFYKNGTSQGVAFTVDSGYEYSPQFHLNGTNVVCNFGQREFAYPPGTASATDYFNCVTYTGNGGNLSVTGVGFQPDFVWIKNRGRSSSPHVLVDVVRGATKALTTGTGGDTTMNGTDDFKSFDSDGFSLGTSSNFFVNSTNDTHVAWCWKAGGAASDNTDGDITSSVSVNQDAGFSVVSYTSQSTKPLNVGHGLGKKPDFILTKNRDATASWGGYHSGTGATKSMFINTTGSGTVSVDYFNNTEPTNSVFTVFDSNNTHSYGTSNEFIAYCWTEKAGVSKFGTYTGNGSSTGPFIECGFKPRLVIVKRTDAGSNWFMYDTIRGTNNKLYAENAGTENSEDGGSTSSNTILSLSNGFQMTSGNGSNASGGTYIFMAFAENFSADATYKALNTANLPAPTVKDGSEYFNTVLYSGNGSTQSITGVGFQPDWVWLKSRNNSYHNYVFDVIRGTGEQLYTNLTNEEFTSSGTLTSFDTDGFSLGNSANADINNSGATFVAWNWLTSNTSGSSNTDGSITSTVSANPSAGFSIGTYTADGSNANRTVGHGLGVPPEFIIVKNRDTSGRHWLIWHKDFNDNDKALLFTTGAVADNRFGPSAPTSTVFGLYGGQGNYNSDDHVFYAFAGVEGYSKLGSYTGNVSTDGPFVYCGFRPSFLLFKRSSAAEDWVITDSVRRTYNQMNGGLRPNGDYIEWSGDDVAIDFTANGFKIRSADAKINASGSTYIFMALAENPFGGSGVSPATAR